MKLTCAAMVTLVGSASGFAFLPTPSTVLRPAAGPHTRPTTAGASRVQPCMLFGGGGKGDDKAGGGGMNMGNMMDSLKKANEIGAKTKALQGELEVMTIDASSADGRVKATVTGQQMPCGCVIDPSLMEEGPEAVQAAVVEAMANAHKESLVQMSKKLSELYQDMGLPMGAMGGMGK